MNVRFSLTKASATVAAIALLTFAGCGSQPDLTPAQQKAGDYAEMNFDLDKCLPIEPNLYRCPAIDKPLCTVEFSRPDIECVRIGAKGHVFVQKLNGSRYNDGKSKPSSRLRNQVFWCGRHPRL
jgi:hypothetical protein